MISGIAIAAADADASVDAIVPSGGACAREQRVTVDPQTGWFCKVALSRDETRLVRVDQRNADIVVQVFDASDHEYIAVDAPTKRASEELVLIGPGLAGRFVVSVRSKDRDASAARAAVSLVTVRNVAGVSLIRGLKDLQLSAKLVRDPSVADSERSLVQLHVALGAFRAASAREYEAEVLLRIAAVYYWQINDWSKAAATAGDAMAAFSDIQDLVMHSQAATLRAASLIEIGDAMKQPGRRGRSSPEESQFEEAKRLLTVAAERFQHWNLPFAQAQAINYLGIAHYFQGDLRGSRSKYLQAARIFEALGESRSAALPLQNIATIDRDQGNYATAIESYQSLLRILNATEDAIHYATVLVNLGNAQYVVGGFEQALRSYMTAFQLCEEKDFKAEAARSLHGLGLVYLAIGDRERATVFLERALAQRRALAKHDPRSLQTSRLRVGDLKRENAEVREALVLHLEALDNALSVTEKARSLYAIGLDHEAAGAFQAAIQAHESALKLPLPEDWPVRVSVLGAYGRARMLAGDDSGRELVAQAARLHETQGDLDLAAQDLLALATYAGSRGEFEAALASINRSISLFEAQRLRAVNPDLRATYLAKRTEAFELQTDLYMSLSIGTRNAKERGRYQNLALLAAARNRWKALEDFRQLARPVDEPNTQPSPADDVIALDAQIAAKRHRLAIVSEQPNPSAEAIGSLRKDISLLRTRLDIAQAGRTASAVASAPHRAPPETYVAIQSTLSSDEALLLYQLGGKRSWLWGVTREAVSVFELPARAELERASRLLYAAWSTPGTLDGILSIEADASSKLLGAVAPMLGSKQKVTIVPDGILRSLPFAALWLKPHAGATRERLGDSHQITFRSRLGADAVETGAKPEATKLKDRILLIGDPSISSAPSRAAGGQLTDPWAWQRLPATRHEIQAIADIASDWHSYVLLGAEATKPALLSMPLDTFRAIHFATHARLDVQDPQLSSIALASRVATFASTTSTLTVREILGFTLSAETVVLSACEASLGKTYRGQISFGLSEAFLLAGAHNVLGSLWRVSDEATQEYMRRFYSEYVRQDASPAAAAQHAARGLSTEPKYRHPYFWAAFVVSQL